MMRHLKALLIVLLATLSTLGFLLFVLLAAGFLLVAATTEEKEVERVTSPDATVDAVVFVVSGGGAAGFGYEYLYLTSKGEPARRGKLALTDCAGATKGF